MSSSKTSQAALRNLAMILLGVGVLVLGFYSYRYTPQGESFELTGEVLEVGSDFFVFEAQYLDREGKFILGSGEKRWVETVRVELSPGAKIEKTIWYKPTDKELEVTGGAWRPDDLKQEKAEGKIWTWDWENLLPFGLQKMRLELKRLLQREYPLLS